MSKPSEIRVAMARVVSARWIAANSTREYRFSAFASSHADVKKTAFLIRLWRDGKKRVASLGDPNPSTGVRERGAGDSFEVWSSDADLMKRMSNWLEGRGFQTTWVF
jgi:hypothetical protein